MIFNSGLPFIVNSDDEFVTKFVESQFSGSLVDILGCISQIVLSGVPLNLGGEVLDNNGVSDCPVCQHRPCRNGGTCRPSRSEYGYECLCPPTYSGGNCELVGQRCTEGWFYRDKRPHWRHFLRFCDDFVLSDFISGAHLTHLCDVM